MKSLNIVILFLFPMLLFGQQMQRVDLSAFAGFANYQGDLSPDDIELKETKISFGGALRYHFTDKVKVRANIYLGFISGSDANDKDGSLSSRGWSFKSDLLEYSLVGEYHPFGKSRFGETGIFRRQISPYVMAGFGVANSRPTVSVTYAEDEALFPEEGFSGTHMVVPVGLGVRADLLEFLSLGFEGGWRVTSDDYLDGVKMNGNPNGKDLYMFIGVSLSYFIGTVDVFSF